MYIVKEINVDREKYVSSKITDYKNKSIATALTLLETAAREFVKEEYGKVAVDNFKILDIYNFDQVFEPKLDSVLIYRIIDDPHNLHVYHKKTSQVDQAGYIFTSWTSSVMVSEFKRIRIFELDECNSVSAIEATGNDARPEMVAVAGHANILIPKLMTIEPICNLMAELKLSTRFLQRQELDNKTSVITQNSQ